MNEMDGACNTYGERKGIYMVLVGKPEGKAGLAVCVLPPHLI